MTATVGEQLDLWEKFAQSDDPEQEAGMGPHTHLGIGLPMSNIFATCVSVPHMRVALLMLVNAEQLFRRVA